MTRVEKTAVLAAAIVSCISSAGCSSSPTVSSATLGETIFHAEVTDSVNDAIAVPTLPIKAPDLIHGTVDVNHGDITFTIQFAPGTLDSQTTRLTIELDTDQNASTGITGASGLGIDYILDLWAPRNSTLIQQATPATCSSGGVCYAQTGIVSLALGTDTMTTTVTLATIGNMTGRINYRVFAYASPQSATPISVADVMPDITLAPAHVP